MRGKVVKVVTVIGNQTIRIVDYPEGRRAELIDHENIITVLADRYATINEQVKALYTFAKREQRRGEATC